MLKAQDGLRGRRVEEAGRRLTDEAGITEAVQAVLQDPNVSPGGALCELPATIYWSAVSGVGPYALSEDEIGLRPCDAVNREAAVALEVEHRLASLRSEDAIQGYRTAHRPERRVHHLQHQVVDRLKHRDVGAALPGR